MLNEMRTDVQAKRRFPGRMIAPAPFEVFEPQSSDRAAHFQLAAFRPHYPSRFLNASRLDALTLRRSEDAFVDELFAPCVGLGAP